MLSLDELVVPVIVFVSLALFMGEAWAAESPSDGKVALRTASLDELTELPGIGPKKALGIMKFRARHGFRRRADLLRVRGIGRRLYFKLKPLVRLGPRQQQQAAQQSCATSQP